MTLRVIRMTYLLIAFVTLGLGLIGVALPIIPTTPFLLLASFFFMKGSARFDAWFRSTRIYKSQLEGFLQHRSMTIRQKVTLLLIADLMIAYPFITLDNLYVRISLILLVLCKYYYFIFKIKNKVAD